MSMHKLRFFYIIFIACIQWNGKRFKKRGKPCTNTTMNARQIEQLRGFLVSDDDFSQWAAIQGLEVKGAVSSKGSGYALIITHPPGVQGEKAAEMLKYTDLPRAMKELGFEFDLDKEIEFRAVAPDAHRGWFR